MTGHAAAPVWGAGLGLSALDLAVALGQFPPTPEQRRVIEAPPAPALVVAGAGSGKTETMAGRVVWLVANGHVLREEILGLTFTRKAAGELAERIGRRLALVDEYGRRGLLPHLPEIVASGALARVNEERNERRRDLMRIAVLGELTRRYGTGWDPMAPRSPEEMLIRPRVSTYNAFADGIVREHAARIGRDPEAAMLSPAASWLIARDVVVRADIPDLEDFEPALSTIIDTVRRLAGDVLDHRVDLDRAERIAREQAEAFAPFRSNAVVDKAAGSLLALPTLLQLVRDYGEEKRRRGVLDFADQVGGAYDIIEADADVRAELRAQHRIVLLDEYQDTSVIQTRFLAALFRDSAVMAVGDPNQSIYGWRGASADNLHAFPGSFAAELPTARYTLMTSFRNDQKVLDVANGVLKALGLQSPGAADAEVAELGPGPAAGPGLVDVRFPLTVDEEAAEVAEWFVARRAAHAERMREKGEDEPHTGAILFRAKTHMPTFAAALAARGVPHRILGLGGLLSAPEVVDVVSALRVIHDPTQGSSLIRLLAGPRFGVGVADLAALHDLAKELAKRDSALLPLPDEVRARLRSSRGADEQGSIVDAVDAVRSLRDDYRLLAGITPEGRLRLRAAGEMLQRLRRAAGQPIPELIRLIEAELLLDLELAAHESRGPARAAGVQLRAFAEEVRAFLAADERGTIGSLLAWLDKAERTDELMPRPEPPEPGVVQLLTIHGSKGLEWHSVAVVRMVKDELPARNTDTAGWFGFGVVPFALRGDAAALPTFSWMPPVPAEGEDPAKSHRAGIASLTSTSAKAPGALTVFKQEYGAYQEREERRLAYVAVTRAQHDLLLTGAHWAGQTRPRAVSPYLDEARRLLGLEEIAAVDPADNPYAGEGATALWPMDPLGARRGAVEHAAAAVRAAMASPRPAAPAPELVRLLAEREARRRGVEIPVPTRVPASRFKDYVTDFAGTVDAIARPMPERPYRQTRLGTLFHAWVENRSGLVGTGSGLDDALWEIDEDGAGEPAEDGAGTAGLSAADATDLARLRGAFERSEWAGLQPIAVEIEIDFALGGSAAGEAEHIVICKLDAVYRREDGRIEIVDWKTGRAPRTAEEREERMLQLALYRLAYHRRFGVPLDEIDVALFYVAEGLIIRGDRVYSEEELVQRFSAARAAR